MSKNFKYVTLLTNNPLIIIHEPKKVYVLVNGPEIERQFMAKTKIFHLIRLENIETEFKRGENRLNTRNLFGT